ncbi:MAG: PD-(D/E)XK nuclease family protein [Sandaracinus sp.]|nr:PD-(D/E)XK nuclease family protein [Sandaracinus sp.]
MRAQVSAGRWGEASSPVAAADSIWEDALRALEQDLASAAVTRCVVPLWEAVGRGEWKRRVRALRTWATGVHAERSGESPQPLSLHPGTRVEPLEVDGVATTGVEQAVVVDELRLRGRPDWSSETATTIDVVEYKSGRLFDSDGTLLQAHRAQLQLYALMLEAVSAPGKEVRLYLEQVDRHRVPWSATQRVAVLDRLREVLDALPSGEVRDAATLANPGPHCRSCRLRPVCGQYLDAAPEWWRGGEGHPRPLPLDVWGELAQPPEGSETLTLRLIDPAGRRVRVDQIDRNHGIAGLSRGQRVWLFDLEASEELRRHGEATHPRNFHEHPPGPRWQRARRLRVFGSSRPPPSS